MTLAPGVAPAAALPGLTRRTEERTPALMETMVGLTRTHTCGQLRKSDAGKEVVLMGWIHRRRDLGGLIFIDLRDREGITQVVFNPKGGDEQIVTKAASLRNEYVVAISGLVEARPEGRTNPALPTGEVELVAQIEGVGVVELELGGGEGDGGPGFFLECGERGRVERGASGIAHGVRSSASPRARRRKSGSGTAALA